MHSPISSELNLPVTASVFVCLSVETQVGQLLVPTLRFVLFLYVQHIQKISLRASLVSGSDEYPSCLRNEHKYKTPDFLQPAEFHVMTWNSNFCCEIRGTVGMMIVHRMPQNRLYRVSHAR